SLCLVLRLCVVLSMRCSLCCLVLHAAPTQIYTLSLHDALPIFPGAVPEALEHPAHETGVRTGSTTPPIPCHNDSDEEIAVECERSEEHTSELQSRENLVCRLLLEKKK